MRRRHNKSMGMMMGAMGLILGGGCFLWLHVWIPIQARRYYIELQSWENKVSIEKARLANLANQFVHLTSLGVLDQWAKKNGIWRNPDLNDIIVIYEPQSNG